MGLKMKLPAMDKVFRFYYNRYIEGGRGNEGNDRSPAGEQSQEHMQLYLEKQVPVSADASGNRTAAGV